MPAEPVSTAPRAPRSRAQLTRFVVLIAVVTAVRLAALPLRGTEDVLTWKIWMIEASKDVTILYGVGGHPPVRGELHWMHHTTTVDYPPVALYELGAVGVFYRLFDPGLTDRRMLTAAVKIPGFLFGIALTVFLWWTVLRLTGDRDRADWVALAYWANPATILNGEVLGYLDPLMMLPAIASLVLLHFRAPEWAGASLAIAMLTKPQALLIAPVLALGAWRTGGIRALVTAGVGGAITAGVIVLPYALVGRSAQYVAGVRVVLCAPGHPLRLRGEHLVDCQLRAARVEPDSTTRRDGSVSRARPAHHGHQHVSGVRPAEPSAVRDAAGPRGERLEPVAHPRTRAIWRSTRSARRSSSTPSSCCRSASTSIT